MLVGYMRVSTTDDRQTVDLQRDALVATGVDHRHLHTDKASGARDDRPGLKACLDYLNAGDTLVRRQNIWHNSRRKLAECGPRQGLDFKRRACGVASADIRWSVV